MMRIKKTSDMTLENQMISKKSATLINSSRRTIVKGPSSRFELSLQPFQDDKSHII